jgi:hypothetical protein
MVELIIEQYLQYIRRQNPVVEGATLSDPIRAVIIQAYDYALKDCGTDRASGEIWQDYLQFLSVPRVSSGVLSMGRELTTSQQMIGKNSKNRIV